MNYDDWKTTEPAYVQGDKPPDDEGYCKECEALPDEPCKWWCRCRQCEHGRGRKGDEAA